jgi:hypothetical protein
MIEEPRKDRGTAAVAGGFAKEESGDCTLPTDPPAGPIEVIVDIGGTEDASGADEVDAGSEPTATAKDAGALAKQTAGHAPVPVSIELVPPGPVGARPAPDALGKATTSVASGAAPSNALTGGVYGLTFPESVQVTIGAKKVGSAWHPVVKNLLGRYSLQARLLPAQTEVTGPSGNTTKTNFCDQVTELARLGIPSNAWYMLSAVTAHENVHATRFGPALAAAEPTITAAIEAVSVPDAPGMTEAAAATALQADAAFVAAVKAAQQTWLAEILTRVAGDHAAGGPTDTAEHAIVDPMVTAICNHAKAQKWGPCPACP